MDGLQIKIARGDPKLTEDAFYIREQVFQRGQGVRVDLDFDGQDAMADHLVAYYSKNPVGCARVRFLAGRAKLERIAVLADYQGKGIGKEIVLALIDHCKAFNPAEIYFDAQSHAEKFYRKLGFETRGQEFQEAGIPHIEMFMPLT